MIYSEYFDSPINIYLIIVLIAGAILVSALFVLLGKNGKVNLALSLASVVIGLYMVEATFFCVNYLRDQRPEDADRRNAMEVVEAMRREGVNAHLSPIPRDYRATPLKVSGIDTFPLTSLANSILVVCNESGVWDAIESDEFGFSNPPGTWQIQSFRAGFVGASTTQGTCTPAGTSFASRLRAMRGPILNLGIAANGPLSALAGIVEYFRLKKPHTVFWIYTERWDFVQLSDELRHHLVGSYLKVNWNQNLYDRNDDIQLALSIDAQEIVRNYDRNRLKYLEIMRQGQINYILRLGFLRDYVRIYIGIDLRIFPRDRYRPHEIFRAILKRAKQEVSSWGGQLMFVYLPEKRSLASGIRDWSQPYLDKTLKELDIPLIDLFPEFNRHPNPTDLYNKFGGHLNRHGHRLAAEIIARKSW